MTEAIFFSETKQPRMRGGRRRVLSREVKAEHRRTKAHKVAVDVSTEWGGKNLFSWRASLVARFWNGTYRVEITILWKFIEITAKKLSKFIKKITHVDDMIIHNLVKYLVQTWLRLWDIKITIFKPESFPDNLLEICYFYIIQMELSL